jgi:glycosyltransferase involved in cell wall biosynthesis
MYDQKNCPFNNGVGAMTTKGPPRGGGRRARGVSMKAGPRVLMLGTKPGGRGGIASVVGTLRDAGLFEREGVLFIATHVNGTGRAKLVLALRSLWQTAALCSLRAPAIVHVHGGSGVSFARKSLLLALGRMAGARTVFHLHGGAFDQFATARAGPLLQRWIRHTLEASSCVIALSPAWARFIRAFAPGAQVEVVPNAVSLPRLNWSAHPGHQAHVHRILFLGRVHQPKGVGDLLDACARLAPRYPHLRLVLAGEGDLDWARARAESLGIMGQVDLPGWLDPDARAAQLARASLFCLPSWAEGVPMALLEAMAAGRPVVVSAVGGMVDVVRDGIDGVLAPPRDAAALAAAIERVLLDPALGARLAHAARARIEQDYSTDTMCRRLAAIYARLTDDEAEFSMKEAR